MTSLEEWQALENAIVLMLRASKFATQGPWSTPGPDTIGEWSIYANKRGWMVASASVSEEEEWTAPALRNGITGAEANRNAHFIAMHNPAWAIAAHEDALARLKEHRPSSFDPGPVGCLGPGCRGLNWWTDCPTVAGLRTIYLEKGMSS